jgi:hypothetical protein
MGVAGLTGLASLLKRSDSVIDLVARQPWRAIDAGEPEK